MKEGGGGERWGVEKKGKGDKGREEKDGGGEGGDRLEERKK